MPIDHADPMLTGAQNAFREIQKVRDFSGAPEEIRTPDPQIRSLVLYPAELRALDSAAGNRPAGRGIAIVLTAYWQELRRELSRRLRGPGQGLVFDTDSI